MSTQLVPEKRIIGGVFGVPEELDRNNNGPFFMKDDSFLVANARSGLYLVVKTLSPSKVWVPSYICRPVIDAVERAGKKVCFYEVDSYLNITSTGWLKDLSKNDLVVVVDYFGFPHDLRVTAEVRATGAVVLEDACQALLSTHEGTSADILLFSPRKFVGIPDGGIVTLNHNLNSGDVRLTLPPQKWWGKALCAGVGRSEFDRMGGSRRWQKLHQEVEEECPVGKYAMSPLARNLLIHGFDYRGIAAIRRDNYSVLAGNLKEMAIFPDLPDGVVPYACPIRLANRDHVLETLLAEDIIPIDHWSLNDVVPADYAASHRLAAEILILPCDQRYDKTDMERISEIICAEGKAPSTGTLV